MFVPSSLPGVLALRRTLLTPKPSYHHSNLLSSRLGVDPSHDNTDPNHIEAKVFVAFHIVGGLGNLAMLITAIASRRVNRQVTWINFCITWVIFSISYTLL